MSSQEHHDEHDAIVEVGPGEPCSSQMDSDDELVPDYIDLAHLSDEDDDVQVDEPTAKVTLMKVLPFACGLSVDEEVLQTIPDGQRLLKAALKKKPAAVPQ